MSAEVPMIEPIFVINVSSVSMIAGRRQLISRADLPSRSVHVQNIRLDIRVEYGWGCIFPMEIALEGKWPCGKSHRRAFAYIMRCITTRALVVPVFLVPANLPLGSRAFRLV
jgi:hypothetical protein